MPDLDQRLVQSWLSRAPLRLTVLILAMVAGCGQSSVGSGVGGGPGSGRTSEVGGTTGTGGTVGAGGVAGLGGAPATGGGPGSDAGHDASGRGGSATGDSGSGGAPAGTGGAGGSAGAGVSVPSSGCGKTSTVVFGMVPGENPNAAVGSGNGVGHGDGGYVTISDPNAGGTRGFALRLPDNYDKNKPYWLIFGFHWNGGNSAQVDNGGSNGTWWSYYGLQRESNNNAIFVAPDGLNAGWANTGGRDLNFVDDMVKLIEDQLLRRHDARHHLGLQLRWRDELRARVRASEGIPSSRDLRRRAAQRV